MDDVVFERGMWDARFAQPGFLFGEAPSRFVVERAALVAPGDDVLCVADGEGRNGVYLAARGARVTSFDVSPVAVAKARALAEARGVQVDAHVAGALEWHWAPARHDAVVAVFIQFAPPPMRERIFAAMVATLRSGGLLLLHGYTPRQIEHGTGGPPFVENMYTEALLRQAFAEHEIVDLAEYEADLDEGTGHAGRSALVDCVVRKGPKR